MYIKKKRNLIKTKPRMRKINYHFFWINIWLIYYNYILLACIETMVHMEQSECL